MKNTLNINADVGEGMGNDAFLMPLIQACNIACGGHTGTALEIQKTIALAQKHKVKIGAHPAYPDPVNFGRKSLKMHQKTLYQTLEQQLCLMLTQLAGEQLHHVKPHGALYHDCITNETIAGTLLEVVELLCPDSLLITASNGALAQLAQKKGIEVWNEAFIDRGYQDNGQLLPRTAPHALLDNPEAIYERIKNLVYAKGVYSNGGNWIPLEAKTLCVHGDTPNAASNLKSALDRFWENEMKK